MALKVKLSPEKIPSRDQPLSVHKLSISRKGKQVLKDTSFELASGEILGIVGKNGSGKTTLVSSIAGTLDLSSSGMQYSHALHDGSDFMEMSPEKRYKNGLHCVFEGRRLFGELGYQRSNLKRD